MEGFVKNVIKWMMKDMTGYDIFVSCIDGSLADMRGGKLVKIEKD